MTGMCCPPRCPHSHFCMRCMPYLRKAVGLLVKSLLLETYQVCACDVRLIQFPSHTLMPATWNIAYSGLFMFPWIGIKYLMPNYLLIIFHHRAQCEMLHCCRHTLLQFHYFAVLLWMIWLLACSWKWHHDMWMWMMISRISCCGIWSSWQLCSWRGR